MNLRCPEAQTLGAAKDSTMVYMTAWLAFIAFVLSLRRLNNQYMQAQSSYSLKQEGSILLSPAVLLEDGT